MALPDRAPLATTLPPQSADSLTSQILRSVAVGPVTFADEPAAPAAPDTLVHVLSNTIEDVLGPGQRLDDIDLIALSERVASSRSRRCSGFAIQFAEVATRLRVFDRRTGAELATTTLSGGRCPRSNALTIDGHASLDVDRPAIVRWLRAQLTRRGPADRGRPPSP